VNGNGWRTRWRWRWVALLAGAVPALAFPGPGVWILVLVGLVPLLLVIRSAPTAREGTLRAWFGGVGFFLAVDHWLVPNVGPALPALAAILAITWLPAGLAAWWALRPAMIPARLPVALVVVPAAWVVGEYARSWQYLGGPWAVLGASQWNDRPVLSVAALGGVWLVSGVLVAVNVAAAAVFVPGMRWPGRMLAAGGGLAVVAAAVGAGVLLGPPKGTATVSVAGAQPGVIADAAARFAGSEQASLALLAGSAAPRPDLVVWGESSVGVDPADEPDYLARIEAVSRAAGADLLVNVDARRTAGAAGDAAGAADATEAGIYKSSLLVDPGGVRGRYDKMRLVPFGEYIPLRTALSWLDRVSRAAAEDRRRGRGLVVLDTSAGLRVGPLVCFESAFPDMARRLTAAGAQLIVVQSSTSTFQQSWAPQQHASLAAVRAVESGRSVVHATLTGVSAVFDPTGRRLAWVGTDQHGGYLVQVPIGTGTTPYVRLGDWVPALSTAIMVGALLAAAVRRHRTRHPGYRGETRSPAASTGWSRAGFRPAGRGSG
jgi:apolipoprotein N-acyltransferase